MSAYGMAMLGAFVDIHERHNNMGTLNGIQNFVSEMSYRLDKEDMQMVEYLAELVCPDTAVLHHSLSFVEFEEAIHRIVHSSMPDSLLLIIYCMETLERRGMREDYCNYRSTVVFAD